MKYLTLSKSHCMVPVGPLVGSVGGVPYEAVPRRSSVAGCQLLPLATRRASWNPHILPSLKSARFIGLPPWSLQMSSAFTSASAFVKRGIIRSVEQNRPILWRHTFLLGFNDEEWGWTYDQSLCLLRFVYAYMPRPYRNTPIHSSTNELSIQPLDLHTWIDTFMHRCINT